MKAVRRTKIRIEKHELKLIQFSGSSRLFCRNCQTETLHLTVRQMALMLDVAEKTIFRSAEVEEIHSLETADGKLLICADSAANFGQ